MTTVKLTRFSPELDSDILKNHELEKQIICDVSTKMAKAIDDEMIKILRTYAVPPIKGEITAGKVKWRGIKMCNQNTFEYSKTWLEQRGVKIGKEIVINYKLNL